MPTAIDQLHNTSPVHPFYLTNHQYSQSLRQCFVKWHLTHLKTAPSLNDVYAGLSAHGFWHGLNLSSNHLFQTLQSRLLSKYTLNPKEQYSIHSLDSFELVTSWLLLQSQTDVFSGVYQYLGDPSLVLHESYLFLRRRCTPGEQVQTSGFWHRDAMGTRLKVFICLDNVEGTTGTSVVGHPYLDPVTHQWEMVRASNASYSDPVMQHLSSDIESFNPNTVIQKAGTILVLDTNTIHRGEYQSICDSTSQPTHRSRALIVLSLIAHDAYKLYSIINKKPHAHNHISVPPSLFKTIPLASPPFFAEPQTK